MKYRPALLALLLPLALAAACDDGGDPTGTAADLAGTYDLIRFAGAALPYVENFGPCTDPETSEPVAGSSELIELQSGLLELNAAGSFVLSLTSREGCRAADGTMIRDWETSVDTSDGTFTRSGSRVRLDDPGSFTLDGTISGSRINVENFLLFERR